jgi:hypothetical protein
MRKSENQEWLIQGHRQHYAERRRTPQKHNTEIKKTNYIKPIKKNLVKPADSHELLCSVEEKFVVTLIFT